jgi:hypothetical protein
MRFSLGLIPDASVVFLVIGGQADHPSDEASAERQLKPVRKALSAMIDARLN